MSWPKGKPRPFGSVGRQKGLFSAAHVELRQRIQEEFDPIGFLGKLVLGIEIDGDKPSLEMRASAAKILSAKVAPDMKAVDITVDATVTQRVEELPDSELQAKLVDYFDRIEPAQVQDVPRGTLAQSNGTQADSREISSETGRGTSETPVDESQDRDDR